MVEDACLRLECSFSASLWPQNKLLSSSAVDILSLSSLGTPELLLSECNFSPALGLGFYLAARYQALSILHQVSLGE